MTQPLLLLYLGWLLQACAAGAADPVLVVYQPPHIEAEVGHPVSLTCTYNYTGRKDQASGKFYKGNDPLKGDDETLRCQSVGSSDTHFSCDVTHTIESPSLADKSVYYCEALVLSIEGMIEVKGSGTTLSLHAQPSSIEIQLSPLVSGHKATLDCKVSGFYPGNPSVLWFCRETPVLPDSITENITRNNEGTFSLHSQYSFSPKVKDHNAVCVCQASHPAWRHTHRTNTTLTVHYGPVAVTVSTDSAVVANGSVLVTNGFTLNLICVADGNPRPKTQWLGGSIKEVHHTETLHIPAVQREDEGLYWCVAQNPYGQQNASITLRVSDSSPAHPGGSKALYSLAAIPIVLVLVIGIVFLRRKGQKNKNALAGQGRQADGSQYDDGELTQSEGVSAAHIVYAAPKRRSKNPPQQSVGPSPVDSSQLIYADIMIPQPIRNLPATSVESVSVYSEVCARGRRQDRRARKQEQDCVYTLTP